MTHVTLAFNRLAPWLNPHHVAIINGDQVIESNGYGQPKGVRMRSLVEYMDEHPDMELRRYDHDDPEAVWQFCMDQVGKPYDWLWYVGFLLRNRDWQDDAAWVCHEMLIVALGAQVSAHWSRPVHLYRLTRRD